MSDYKISVKNPKSDNENKIQGTLYSKSEGVIKPGNKVIWTTESRLRGLPNPYTNPITNLLVANNTGEIYIKSETEIIVNENDILSYLDVYALNTSLTDLQAIVSYRYGINIELKYDEVITEPTGPSASPLSTGPEIIATNSNTTPVSPVVTSTTSNTREYTFDVQIKDTFYNSEIGYLTITGKIDNTFVYGDEQDTIDPEYTEDTFAGSEEDQLLLASIEQIYSAEELASLPPEEVKIIKENAKAAQKLGKPLKSPPSDLIIAMRKYGITNKLERAHFLAQCAHESGNYVYKSELASGRAYEGRKDLGNIHPGDGPKFKGRGFIQVTGRANYEAYSKYLVSKGLDNVLNNPDLVATKYAADAACYWWKFLSRDITSIAKRGASTSVVESVTRRVNGGTNGLNDRQQKFDKLWSEIQQDESRYA